MLHQCHVYATCMKCQRHVNFVTTLYQWSVNIISMPCHAMSMPGHVMCPSCHVNVNDILPWEEIPFRRGQQLRRLRPVWRKQAPFARHRFETKEKHGVWNTDYHHSPKQWAAWKVLNRMRNSLKTRDRSIDVHKNCYLVIKCKCEFPKLYISVIDLLKIFYKVSLDRKLLDILFLSIRAL